MNTLLLVLTLAAPVPRDFTHPSIEGEWVYVGNEEPRKCFANRIAFTKYIARAYDNDGEELKSNYLPDQFKWRYGDKPNTIKFEGETWVYIRDGNKLTITRFSRTAEFIRAK